MRCRPQHVARCRPAVSGSDIGALIRAYRIHNLQGSLAELEFFRRMRSVRDAIHHAALAIDGRGKRFSHQRRIPASALVKAESLLADSTRWLKRCSAFHELHTFLARLFEPVHGLGELYVYDTALRLGSFLNLRPEYVYIHAGTRSGARARLRQIGKLLGGTHAA